MAWAGSAPSVVSLGDNTYSVTASARDKFTRNTQKLKAQAMEAATQFCVKEGKQFKLVSATEDKSFYFVGDFAKATVVFKTLAPGDPELDTSAGNPAKPATTVTDSLYDELLKLDDLRKKGILTEEEFAVQKKKVLDRSK